MINDDINSLIKSSRVFLFVKGTDEIPQCGFSAFVVNLFKHMGVEFSFYNVLENNEMREGIKKYSNWPTIPQIYIDNEFIGGCDIIKEMYENGELEQMLNEKKLIN